MPIRTKSQKSPEINPMLMTSRPMTSADTSSGVNAGAGVHACIGASADVGAGTGTSPEISSMKTVSAGTGTGPELSSMKTHRSFAATLKWSEVADRH